MLNKHSFSSHECVQIVCSRWLPISIRNYFRYLLTISNQGVRTDETFILFALTWLICAGTALAQGVQTGAIRGMVQDQQDRTVPGASVTVTSPALLGPRSTVTDGHGNYSLTALPPGNMRSPSS